MPIAADDEALFSRSREDSFELTDEVHRQLLDGVRRGLADIAAGRTEDAGTAIDRLRQRRAYRPPR